MEDHQVEAVHIKITAKSRKKIVIGSLYRPPNTTSGPFGDHIKNTVTTVYSENREEEIILGMDHNYDL